MKTSLSNLQEISDTLSKVERMLGAEGTGYMGFYMVLLSIRVINRFVIEFKKIS